MHPVIACVGPIAHLCRPMIKVLQNAMMSVALTAAMGGLSVFSSCTECRNTDPRIRVVNNDSVPVTFSVLTGDLDTAYFLNIAPNTCTEWRTFTDIETQATLFDALMVPIDSAIIDLRHCHEYQLVVDTVYDFKVQERKRD
jgi:hypothetical protein